MLNQDIIIQRLALIKQLYQIGCEQAKQVESIAVFSILSFHDSIEMFLRLLVEHKDIKKEEIGFMKYFDKLPELTMKESMRALNEKRVNLKHKGILPGKPEIEKSRINTADFFDQNTITQFDINFSEISLIDLVTYTEVRKYLKLAEECLMNNNTKDCIGNSAFAFNELLSQYEKSKTSEFGRSPFFFGSDFSFHNISFLVTDPRNAFDKNFSKFVKYVNESLEEIRNAVKITSFGIDYKKFIKFQMLTPKVFRGYKDNLELDYWRNKKVNKDNCQFCIDFVIYAAMTLQEFDFDIESLEVDE
jgi:hypothetical protein